jgi:hypothetical protein
VDGDVTGRGSRTGWAWGCKGDWRPYPVLCDGGQSFVSPEWRALSHGGGDAFSKVRAVGWLGLPPVREGLATIFRLCITPIRAMPQLPLLVECVKPRESAQGGEAHGWVWGWWGQLAGRRAMGACGVSRMGE